MSSLSRVGTTVVSPPGRTSLRREVKAVFARYDKGGDGFIDQDDLAALLGDLNGRAPTKTEVLFALKGMDTSADGRVSFSEFLAYWEKAKAGHTGGKLNKLLVKDRVGTVRVSSYDLPPVDHAFGMKNPEQEFGTKEVLGGWSGKEGEAPHIGATWAPQRTLDQYGRPNKPSTPVSKVIRAEYAGGAATAPETSYPTLPSRKKDKLVPKSTVATELRTTVVTASLTAAETKPWKMKKFEAVKSKLAV